MMSFNSNIPTMQNQAQPNLLNQPSPQFSSPQYQRIETDGSLLNDIPASGATTFIPLAQPGPGIVQRSEKSYQRHKASLIQCQKCGRSFFPHTITYHELNCKAGKLSEHKFNTKTFRQTINPTQSDRVYQLQRPRPSTQPSSFNRSFPTGRND